MKEKDLSDILNKKISYLKNILLNIPGCVYWKDLAGTYMGCNRIFLDMVGLQSEKDVIGKTDEDFCWKDQANDLRKHDLSVMESGEIKVLEEEVNLANGEKKLYSVIKTPFFDEEGNIIGIVGTSVDINYRKEIEDNLKKAKIQAEAASKSKSEFIANMSHDLRTPITGMLAMVQDMLNTADQTKSTLQQEDLNLSSPKYSSLLTNIIATVHRDGELLMASTDELLQLCNEILEIVRLESGTAKEKLESFNLRELVEHNIELLQPVAQHKNLQLLQEIEQTVPNYLNGLRIYFDRILLNLISNALKFTETGFVKVKVQLSRTDNTSYQIDDNIILYICVEDSGIGIPKDKFDTIFEHFSRLTPAYEGLYKGAGLGLYTVKRYVQAMNGKISLDSDVGKGTYFTVILPFTVSDHSDRKKESVRLPKRFTAMTKPSITTEIEDTSTNKEATTSVLIVEDNAMAAIAVQLSLKPFNCALEVAKNGAEAVKMAQSSDYDLILMDVGLPDFSGVEVTKQIRALSEFKKSQVPIVALTGHAGNPEKRQECLDAGMQDILSKPAQPLALESILQQYVFKTTVKIKPQNKTQPLSTASESMVVIDWDACVRMCNGSPDLTRELLSVLTEDLKTTKETLAKAYATKNKSALRAELHRTRGGVCYLKLPQLENALKMFHQAVESEPQGVQQLEKTYAELQQAMDTFWETWKMEDF